MANEGVLDAPAPADDRLLAVGEFVAGQHLVDGGVADSVGGDAPAQTVDDADGGVVTLGAHRLEAAELAAFAVRLLVGLTHEAALEPAVHPHLDAADPEHRVA